MKSAIIAAVVAATVAAGTAGATTWISGRSIRPHSIPLNRLHGTLPKGPQGPAGPQGQQGTQGAQGAPGLVDLSKLSLVDSGAVTVVSGTTNTAVASCPSGDKVTGGGFIIVHGNDDGLDAYASGPNSALTVWSTTVANSSSFNASIRAYAVCVSP
jgi:hypothetical protein